MKILTLESNEDSDFLQDKALHQKVNDNLMHGFTNQSDHLIVIYIVKCLMQANISLIHQRLSLKPIKFESKSTSLINL